MKKWKLVLAFFVALAALALGLAYLAFMDEADPSQPPAAPLVWLASAMEKAGVKSKWANETLTRDALARWPRVGEKLDPTRPQGKIEAP